MAEKEQPTASASSTAGDAMFLIDKVTGAVLRNHPLSIEAIFSTSTGGGTTAVACKYLG